MPGYLLVVAAIASGIVLGAVVHAIWFRADDRAAIGSDAADAPLVMPVQDAGEAPRLEASASEAAAPPNALDAAAMASAAPPLPTAPRPRPAAPVKPTAAKAAPPPAASAKPKYAPVEPIF